MECYQQVRDVNIWNVCLHSCTVKDCRSLSTWKVFLAHTSTCPHAKLKWINQQSLLKKPRVGSEDKARFTQPWSSQGHSGCSITSSCIQSTSWKPGSAPHSLSASTHCLFITILARKLSFCSHSAGEEGCSERFKPLVWSPWELLAGFEHSPLHFKAHALSWIARPHLSAVGI